MELKPSISYEDFSKLDIRVGTIVKVGDVEESEKLIKLTVDFGNDIGERTIFAGIKRWYQPEELVGLQTIFLANLEPKKMPGGESQGMLLATDGKDGKPALFSFKEDVENGSKAL